MKTKIQSILTNAIGEDKQKGTTGMSPDEILGYNQALQDLRNKIPNLTDKIVEEVGNQMIKVCKGDDDCIEMVADIINLLKK